MEKKENWGGALIGAGRPRRSEEQDVIKLFDEYIDRGLVVSKLLEKIKQKVIQKQLHYTFQYIYGKPITNVNQTTTLTVNDVDISKLVSFESGIESNNKQ